MRVLVRQVVHVMVLAGQVFVDVAAGRVREAQVRHLNRRMHSALVTWRVGESGLRSRRKWNVGR